MIHQFFWPIDPILFQKRISPFKPFSLFKPFEPWSDCRLLSVPSLFCTPRKGISQSSWLVRLTWDCPKEDHSFSQSGMCSRQLWLNGLSWMKGRCWRNKRCLPQLTIILGNPSVELIFTPPNASKSSKSFNNFATSYITYKGQRIWNMHLDHESSSICPRWMRFHECESQSKYVIVLWTVDRSKSIESLRSSFRVSFGSSIWNARNSPWLPVKTSLFL